MDNKDLLNMTRWNALCAVFLILILAFAGREAYVSHDLALDRQEVIMTSGDSTVLQPNHVRNLIWRSDDPTCVSVQAGKIRAGKAGETLVKASYLWKTVEIPVKVEEPVLSEETVRLRLGEQHQLKLLCPIPPRARGHTEQQSQTFPWPGRETWSAITAMWRSTWGTDVSSMPAIPGMIS